MGLIYDHWALRLGSASREPYSRAPGRARSGQVGPGRARSGQVEPGRARLGQVEAGSAALTRRSRHGRPRAAHGSAGPHCSARRSRGRTMVLKPEINELLTRAGPGTPMGQLFRQYWVPALLADELPDNDCPPVRVKLLSERLIAFRDSEGRYGLIDEFCAHRGVSLWFGRNEERGLRCSYHGW